ncbi:MAG: hypothetical protein ACKO14_09940 [Armatimonadota bacterium]
MKTNLPRNRQVPLGVYLLFEVNIEPKQLVGFVSAWASEPDQPETSDAFSQPEAWLPALEAPSHPGRLILPHTLPEA